MARKQEIISREEELSKSSKASKMLNELGIVTSDITLVFVISRFIVQR
jgi:hypothetical protein